MNRYYFFIILMLLFQSCATFKKGSDNRKQKEISDLTHQIIYSRFDTVWLKNMEEKGSYIYIAPMLKYRKEFYPNTRYGFDKEHDPMSIEKLLEGYLVHGSKADSIWAANDILLDYTDTDSIPFIIREEYKDVIKYFSDTVNLETEKRSSYFFSPLLLTREKDMFLIQSISLGKYSLLDENGEPAYTSQMIWRKFLKYRIKGKKFEYLNDDLHFETYMWSVD